MRELLGIRCPLCAGSRSRVKNSECLLWRCSLPRCGRIGGRIYWMGGL